MTDLSGATAGHLPVCCPLKPTVKIDAVTRRISSTSNGTDNSVTMVAALYIRAECWEEFRSAYLQFLLQFEKLRGHVSVTFFCQADGTPLDRQLSIAPGSVAIEEKNIKRSMRNTSNTSISVKVLPEPVLEHTLEAVHKFESLALMKEALGSKIRNDWDARLPQWTTKAPEFYSYSGLTGFFALNRTFSPEPGPAPQPPPKWKVGLVILMTACVWACILDFSTAIIKLQMSIFPKEGPPSDNQRAGWEFAVTSINLVPVFFLWAPLIMELFFIRAWFAVPWTKPGPQDTQGLAARLLWNPIRWVFF